MGFGFGFGSFFEALSNHETHEYKDLQLLLALAKRFWDTTCTFHFPNIGEVMLTPYEFFVITGLRLGGKRILVNDSLTSTELKKLRSEEHTSELSHSDLSRMPSSA